MKSHDKKDKKNNETTRIDKSVHKNSHDSSKTIGKGSKKQSDETLLGGIRTTTTDSDKSK